MNSAYSVSDLLGELDDVDSAGKSASLRSNKSTKSINSDKVRNGNVPYREDKPEVEEDQNKNISKSQQSPAQQPLRLMWFRQILPV